MGSKRGCPRQAREVAVRTPELPLLCPVKPDPVMSEGRFDTPVREQLGRTLIEQQTRRLKSLGRPVSCGGLSEHLAKLVARLLFQFFEDPGNQVVIYRRIVPATEESS